MGAILALELPANFDPVIGKCQPPPPQPILFGQGLVDSLARLLHSSARAGSIDSGEGCFYDRNFGFARRERKPAMPQFRPFRLLTPLLLLLPCACYRTTGLPEEANEIFQVSGQNPEDLPAGVDSTSRNGDLVMRSRWLQFTLDGSFGEVHRSVQGWPAPGAMVDINSRQPDSFNILKTNADDATLFMGCGLNLDPELPVRYLRAELREQGEDRAVLALIGGVSDRSRKLQGVSWDEKNDLVQGLVVETLLELTNTRASATNSAEVVRHLRLSSVVENQSSADLPIFTLNDAVLLAKSATRPFIAYPGFGYHSPGGMAFPPYVSLHTTQSATCQLSFFSLMDGYLSAQRVDAEDDRYEWLMIGKAQPTTGTLPPGARLTHLREMLVMGSGAQPSTVYAHIVRLFQDLSSAPHPWRETGTLKAIWTYNGSSYGSTTYNLVQEDFPIHNGHGLVPLGSASFPIYGDNAVAPGINQPVPLGRMTVQHHLVNHQPILIDRKITTSEDDEGNPVTSEEPILIEKDEIFDLGVVTIGDPMLSVYPEVTNTEGRKLMSRIRILPTGETRPTLQGDLPRFRQGSLCYVIAPDAVFSGFLGSYQAMMGRGPLYNLNLLDITIEENTDEEGTVTRAANPSTFKAQMNPAIVFPGHLSADFSVRSHADALGSVDRSQLVLMAYAEDLDVLMFHDTNHPDDAAMNQSIESRFLSVAAAQGPFDEADRTNKILSLQDELAVARTLTVQGAATAHFPYGKGSFSLFRLPGQADEPRLEPPDMPNDPAELFAAVRDTYPSALIQVMRPRAPLAHRNGYFTALAMSAGTPQEAIDPQHPDLRAGASGGADADGLDFDLLQVLVGNHYDEYLLARADWFALLNAGIFKPATGGSDAQQVADIPLGQVRTFVKTANTRLRDNDLNQFWDQVAAGSMFVSNGPLITASIESTTLGGHLRSDAALELTLKIQAAPWIPVPELRIVVDGLVVNTLPLVGQGDLVRFEGSLTLDLPSSGSHWVVVEAGSSLADLAHPQQASGLGDFARFNQGHLPLAFTNPIFIERGN